MTVGPTPPAADGTPGGTTVAARVGETLAAGGVLMPLLAVLIAFIAGGLVVLATGEDPVSTYRAIWDGTGLSWLFPWTSGDDRELAAVNLQQTLIITGPLILLGLAVAYAFRAGLFNIGAQGQYAVGSIAAVYVGSNLDGLPSVLHVLLSIVAAVGAGAVWGGIAGLLRATTGANEVITTIMLNYIALWVGIWLFGLGGPLQNATQPDIPVSEDVLPDARLPVFWGDAELQGLHVGIFIAVLGALVFWVLLNRTTKGYEARAVGLNPEAARYGGIRVGRTYVLVMASCGAFAGLAGSLDVLGWQFRIATNDIQAGELGFLGIAVALLGRNSAFGVCLAALLFGSLVTGTSVRNLDPAVFEPSLAENLTTIIQGIVVLLVTVDVLLLTLFNKLRRRREPPMPAAAAQPAGGAG